jgi:hypothetical protein
MACNCLEKIQETLKEQAATDGLEYMRVETVIDFASGQSYPYMTIENKRGKRKNKITLVPTCCPFCGKKYKKIGGKK